MHKSFYPFCGPARLQTAKRRNDRTTYSFVDLTAIPIALLISHRTRRALLALLVLNLSWRVEKHFFRHQAAGDLGSLSGLQVSLSDIALILLYASWLVRAALRAEDALPKGQDRIIIPAVMFLLACVVSLSAATDLSLSVFEVVNVTGRLLLYVYIAKTLSSVEDVVFVLRILLIGLVIQSLLMLAQVGGLLGTIDIYGIKARAEFEGESRVSGTIGSPNTAAAYLAMNMTIALSVLMSPTRRLDRRLALAGLILAFIPMVMTLSRGGWLSLLLDVLLLIALGGTSMSRKWLIACLATLALFMLPFLGAIQTRIYGDDGGSAASRIPLNHLAIAMTKDHLWAGVGANNFSVAMQPYLAHYLSGDFVYTVHNTYLLMLVETGIAGLAAFSWLLIAIVYQGIKVWQQQDPAREQVAIACSIAVVGFMLQLNFEPVRGGGAGHIIWLLGGLVTALNRPEYRHGTYVTGHNGFNY